MRLALLLLAILLAAPTAAAAEQVSASGADQPLILELRIAADPSSPPSDMDARLRRLSVKGPAPTADGPWKWYELYDVAMFADRAPAVMAQFAANPQAFTRWARDSRNLVGGVHDGRFFILLADTPDKAMVRGEGWGFKAIYRTEDQMMRKAIAFDMDAAGAQALGNLTEPHLGRQLAVLVNDKVLTAPTLQAKLTTGGIISGNFSPAEFDHLIQGLQAGRDPVGRAIMLGLAGCSGLFALLVTLGAIGGVVMFVRGRLRAKSEAAD